MSWLTHNKWTKDPGAEFIFNTLGTRFTFWDDNEIVTPAIKGRACDITTYLPAARTAFSCWNDCLFSFLAGFRETTANESTIISAGRTALSVTDNNFQVSTVWYETGDESTVKFTAWTALSFWQH